MIKQIKMVYKLKEGVGGFKAGTEMSREAWVTNGLDPEKLSKLFERGLVPYTFVVREFQQERELPANRNLRDGQLAMKVLAVYNPRLYLRIQGTDIDPYHADKRLPEFTEFVKEHWEDKPLGQINTYDVWPESLVYVVYVGQGRHAPTMTRVVGKTWAATLSDDTNVLWQGFEEKHAQVEHIKAVAKHYGIDITFGKWDVNKEKPKPEPIIVDHTALFGRKLTDADRSEIKATFERLRDALEARKEFRNG